MSSTLIPPITWVYTQGIIRLNQDVSLGMLFSRATGGENHLLTLFRLLAGSMSLQLYIWCLWFHAVSQLDLLAAARSCPDTSHSSPPSSIKQWLLCCVSITPQIPPAQESAVYLRNCAPDLTHLHNLPSIMSAVPYNIMPLVQWVLALLRTSSETRPPANGSWEGFLEFCLLGKTSCEPWEWPRSLPLKHFISSGYIELDFEGLIHYYIN